MKLTPYEQETIINWNQGEANASVFTYDKSLMRKIDKIRSNNKAVSLLREGNGFREYSLPKKMITIKEQRKYSEETLEKLGRQAKERFSKKEDADNVTTN